MSEEGGFTRRNFIKSAALFSCGVSMGLATQGCASMRAITRSYNTDNGLPNIILITADDLGWKDLGCYGNSEISTPNIDCIAANGVLFTNAFVVSSSCAPSRASFITGQYPHTNRVDGLTHIHKRKSLSPFHTTLPEILSQKGYNTALEGKWHVSPYLPASWYGYNKRLSGMLPKDMWIKDTEKTLEFIRANKDNRFYLEVNYMNNHRDDNGEFHFDPEFPVDPAAVHVPEYWTLPDWDEIRLEVAKFYSQTM
ncbi:MAG: sulfatase-like hydrolase/transferase, partial [Deltaproteobacteria bacterium]|nr:sulfatase-like hydrolase/transferase [Deltaproteobacteria bacterium]